MTTHRLPIILALAVLALASLACGSSNTGAKIGTSIPSAAPEGTPSTAPKVETYKPGDIVQIADHTIILNTAAVQAGQLKASFTIENKGAEDLAVSSLLSFTAKDSEGSKLELAFMDCGASSLDGKILPADKLKGDICWKAPGAGPYKIYYQADLFGSGAIVWEIPK
jgi:hypothetical protein